MDLEALLESWMRRLAAERKSPHTLRTYRAGVDAYLSWVGTNPTLSRDDVLDWTRHMLDGGLAAATVWARQGAVRRFSAWLADEGETGHDDLVKIRPPKRDDPMVEALTRDQLRALIGTCKGKAFHHVRDRAVIQLLAETGARASELTGMQVYDVDLDRRRMIITRGKGGQGRVVGFSAVAADYLDTYLRARRRHPKSVELDRLWLGDKARGFSYSALYHMIVRRGQSVGLAVYPHQLRNTSAVRWLQKGGSPQGAMAQHGWRSVDMLRRYIRAAEAELAAEEADRLNLGDI